MIWGGGGLQGLWGLRAAGPEGVSSGMEGAGVDANPTPLAFSFHRWPPRCRPRPREAHSGPKRRRTRVLFRRFGAGNVCCYPNICSTNDQGDVAMVLRHVCPPPSSP